MSVVEIHTGDPELAELCSRYWAQDPEGEFIERVKDLAAAYSVAPHRVPTLVREHSTARSTDDVCADCEEGRVLASRSDLSAGRWRKRYAWRCSACEKARREDEQRTQHALEATRRQQVDETWGVWAEADPTVDVSHLTLEQAVGLLALIRVGADEDVSRITPRTSWSVAFTPDPGLDIEILTALYKSRLVAVDPGSPLDAFDWDSGSPDRFYLGYVGWLAPGAQQQRPLMSVATQLERAFRAGEWQPGWAGEVDGLWRRLALAECIAYLQLCMDDHALSMRAGDKTKLVISECLERFSIGQTFNFIWRAARDAAAYYMRGSVPKQQAANSVVSRIQGGAERALAEGWDVKPYGRERRLPESALSGVFFRAALCLAEPLRERPPTATGAV